MKYKSIIFVLAILGAIAMAGCTSISNTGTTAGSTSSGVSATPLPAIGDTLNVTTMMDLSKAQWYKYQVKPSGTPVDLGSGFTTKGSTMTERWDFNVDYNGQKADKVSGTADYPSNGATGTTTTYLDPTDHKKLLGGDLTVVKNGKVVYQGGITPNLLSIQSLLDLTNSSYYGQHSVTYGGVETVTVPLGTYTVTKYIYNGTYALTVYVDPKIPVPVKVEAVTTSGTIYDVELMGWG